MMFSYDIANKIAAAEYFSSLGLLLAAVQKHNRATKALKSA